MGLQSTAGIELLNKQTALNEKIIRSVGTHTSGKALNTCRSVCISVSYKITYVTKYFYQLLW